MRPPSSCTPGRMVTSGSSDDPAWDDDDLNQLKTVPGSAFYGYENSQSARRPPSAGRNTTGPAVRTSSVCASMACAASC